MNTLNTPAKKLADKYIQKATDASFVDTRKGRGLQAEILKLDSIKKILLTSKISERELLRFRGEVTSLLSTTNHLLQSVDAQ